GCGANRMEDRLVESGWVEIGGEEAAVDQNVDATFCYVRHQAHLWLLRTAGGLALLLDAGCQRQQQKGRKGEGALQIHRLDQGHGSRLVERGGGLGGGGPPPRREAIDGPGVGLRPATAYGMAAAR